MAKGELTATPPNEYLTPAIYIGLDAPPSGNEIYPTPAAWPLFCNEISGSIPNEPFCSVVSHTVLTSVCISLTISIYSLTRLVATIFLL